MSLILTTTSGAGTSRISIVWLGAWGIEVTLVMDELDGNPEDYTFNNYLHCLHERKDLPWVAVRRKQRELLGGRER